MAHSFTRSPVSFDSEGETCSGVVYVPEGSPGNVPCVVMANGFSGTMDWIVPSFAERFASAGFAALIFDYRHLGRSEGQPRQLVDVRKQRTDLRMAVALARRLEGIDPDRVALWGTSLGGSHVVELAAQDARICALICNVPGLDVVKGGNAAAKAKAAHASPRQLVTASAQLLAAAALDAARGWLGLSPHYLPVYGKPGRAFFTDPALAENFRRVEAQSPTWQNRVAPRFLFGAPRYRAGTIERIVAPILFSLARNDVELSNAFVKDVARRAAHAEVKEYPVGHFGMYHEAFEAVSADQVDFLRRHLPGPRCGLAMAADV